MVHHVFESMRSVKPAMTELGSRDRVALVDGGVAVYLSMTCSASKLSALAKMLVAAGMS